MTLTCPETEKNASAPMNYEPNQRRYPRYELDTEVSVTVSGMEKRDMRRGRSLNLNQAGMGGLFVAGWDVGTSVNLEFSVPVSSTLLTVGAVVRSQLGHRYGFEFVDLSLSQQEIIAKACTTLGLLQ